MERYLDHITEYLLGQSWQIAVLVCAVAVASWLLRNRSAHVRYLLWLIVLAKCLVPPLLTFPLSILPSTEAVTVVPAETSSVTVSTPAEPEPAAPEYFPTERPMVSVATQRIPRFNTRQWLGLAWLLGACIYVVVAIVRALRTSQWLRRNRTEPPDQLQSILHGLGVRARVKVWLIEGIGQPFVWGLLKGDIYLPGNSAKVRTSEHMRSILGHELGHVLRFDAAVNVLQVLAQAIFWFHPFVWWANKRIRAEREKCCDETAIARLGTRAKEYSAAIVETLVAEYESTRPVPSLAVAGPVKNIEERIKTMMRPGKKFYKRPSLKVAVVVLIFASLTIPTTFVLTARGGTQPPVQSVTSEKPEQSRFAARTFNSEISFDVWFREAGDSSNRPIGRTPSATPLEIPACWLWGVGITSPVDDRDLLIREVKQNEVPGLILGNAVDSDLKQLSVLTKLRLLSLMSSKITDAGLEYLKGMSLLEQLYLAGTSITDTGLEHLKDLTGLQNLLLGSSLITDNGLEHLKGMTGLKSLNLELPKITNDGLKHLKGLSGLEALYLGGGRPRSQQIKESGLEHLKGMTGLKILVLWDTPLTDVGLEYLKNMTSLETLWFERNDSSITDKGLEHIKGLTNLGELPLMGMKITDEGLDHLKGLKSLYWLSLSQTSITDAGLEQIKGLNGLKQLDLDGTPITDAGIEHLKGMAGLETLNLNNTSITDKGLDHLEDMTGLRFLYLNNTSTTDTGLEYLKGLTGLRGLSLSNTQVTEAGVQQLQQILPKLTINREQPTTQSADKPTTDSEKPEPPRFAARTFNSEVEFDVWIQEASTSGEWQIGRTPSATPLEISACWLWGVQPSAPVNDWDLLIREISQNEIPSLYLVGRVAND